MIKTFFCLLACVVFTAARAGAALDMTVTNLDNQQRNLYISTTAPGITGTVAQWTFFKPPGSAAGYYTGSWVTPVILEKFGGNYTIRGIGRSRPTTAAGVYLYDFDLVSGSNELLNTNYTYGHYDYNLNNTNGTIGASIGSIGWNGSGGSWS